MNVAKRLTKSRFKVGSECSRKLFYLDNKQYGNKKTDDSFLNALAEGGFQVGELAKCYHPKGIQISEKDYETSITKTKILLAEQSATIFEAAIGFDQYFVRVDILKKYGDMIELIEVKAKSFDSAEEVNFFSKRGKKKSIKSDWEEYLIDITFQTFVLRKAFPKLKVTSFIMLADKNKTATVDGLNQRFLITKNTDGKTKIRIKDGTDLHAIGENILCKINVDEYVHFLLEEEVFGEKNFEQYSEYLANIVTNRIKDSVHIEPSKCKNCEFRIDTAKFPEGTTSGFMECFTESIGMKPTDYSRPFVFDVWNFRKSHDLFENGCYFMDQMHDDDISVKDSDHAGMSSTQRQLLQVQKIKNNDFSSYLNIEGLKSELASWKFPLHFIDFETTMVAIPFTKGRRPYEQVAFQFSHHVVHENGVIEHKDQYIHSTRGEFPNFKFVRALKNALDKDNGTIFRYSNHENTVLCQIARQLQNSDVPDSSELIEWIRSVTTLKSNEETNIGWTGHRTMVDLCDLVKRYYYNPMTNGSNSIKKVLPAVLNESLFLRDKYSKPIYGSKDGILSLNFLNWTSLNFDSSGKIKDPYKLLPPVFTEEELSEIELLTNSEEIADGGAAMTAFAKMQFTEMPNLEAKKIQDALLKYCELDTLAMVMIYEHWKAEIKEVSKISR